jgi:MinD-like ATPase involved in chromosome partitioning or flagellar assembly
MYIITFYSFKGGVGRTMALVNVAVQLALAGKKVLVVDFDLEAPGVPTFSLTAPKEAVSGLVEYISDYRRSGVAPDATQYVYSAARFPTGGELWVMPAGRHDGSYSQRLNSIDWHALYEREEGYLFFEDLKRQWDQSLAPDYVLIDSRTGHSDVEGICTRQLPDSVCMLFFPNEQNLQGIKKVVENIRLQNSSRQANRQPIALHFVVSNVPDLDDEEGIIGSTLSRFQDELGYEELSGQIHHYNSLSLLHQEIFSDKRPNSRLAKEYKSLAQMLVQENISDRDVATKFLRQSIRELRSVNARSRAQSLVEKVERILRFFPADLEIVLDVAIVYEAIGRTTDALALLTAEIGEPNSRYFGVRARLNHKVGNKTEAISDLRTMLDREGAQAPALLEALSLASQLDSSLFDVLPNSRAFKSLSMTDRVFVATELEGGRHELQARAVALEELMPLVNGDEKDNVRCEFALTCIGLGRFEKAIELLGGASAPGETLDVGDVFNLAMARWGLDQTPPKNLFAKVIELHEKDGPRDGSANYFACVAIADAVLANKDSSKRNLETAAKLIKSRPKREFSPWTYTKVSSRMFTEHLSEIERQLSSGKLQPEFVGLGRLLSAV